MLLYQESFDSVNDTYDLAYNQRVRLLDSTAGVSNLINTTGGRFGGGCYSIAALLLPVLAPLNVACTNTTIRMAWSMKVNDQNAGSTTGGRVIAGFQAIDPITGVTTRWFRIWMLTNLLTIGKFDDIPNLTTAWQSTTNINDNAWHHYEIELLAHTSAGTFKLWIDGNLEVNQVGVDTSDAVSGDVTAFNYVEFGGSSQASGTVDMKWDDIIVWDDASGGMTGHLSSPHRISVGIRPDAAGDSADFTPSAGNNFDCVNAQLTNDDTNYVESGTPGHRDLYGVSAMVANPVSIFAVALEHWARKEDIGPLTYKTAVKSNGTLSYGTTITPFNGYFRRYQEWLNPDGNIAWTKGALEVSQIGAEIVT